MSKRQTPADPGRSSQAARAQAATVAALAVAAGKPIATAAAEAGIGERTLYTWLRKTEFKRRVDELRDRLVSEAVGKLSKSMGSAADVLEKLLRSRDEGTRLKSSRAILELAVRLRDHDEMARRLADLERRLDEGGQ